MLHKYSGGKINNAEPMVELPKIFLFYERMKRLFPHQLPLKERMKDRTISYVDLLCQDSHLTKLEKNLMKCIF